MLRLLIFLVKFGVSALRVIFLGREELLIENLALRQQVAALKKKHPQPVVPPHYSSVGAQGRALFAKR